MSTHTPAPPPDWFDHLRDHVQVKNLINGDSCILGTECPTAQRLFEFLSIPAVSEAWERFNRGRPRLR